MKYNAFFDANGQQYACTVAYIASEKITMPMNLLKSRMKNPAFFSSFEANIVQQILVSYPDAHNIVLEMVEDEQESQNKNDKNGDLAVLILLAIFISVLIAPILLTFAMFGKLMLKKTFQDVLDYDDYKKFRKIHLILSYSWMLVCIVLFVIFTILPVDYLISMIPFYALFFGNITFVILAIVKVKRLKKAHAQETSEVLEKDDGEMADRFDNEEELDHKTAEPDRPDESPDVENVSEFIEKLNILHEKGLITDDEYSKNKDYALKAMFDTVKSSPKDSSVPSSNYNQASKGISVQPTSIKSNVIREDNKTKNDKALPSTNHHSTKPRIVLTAISLLFILAGLFIINLTPFREAPFFPVLIYFGGVYFAVCLPILIFIVCFIAFTIVHLVFLFSKKDRAKRIGRVAIFQVTSSFLLLCSSIPALIICRPSFATIFLLAVSAISFILSGVCLILKR